MTQDEYTERIGHLTGEAEADPAGYRWNVAGWIGLGYLYLFGSVLFLWLAAIVVLVIAWSMRGLGAIVAKFAFALVILSFVVLRALWVRLDPPEGVEVTREGSPRLFDMIEAVREEIGSRPLHRVLLRDDLNAGIVQVPRLGFLGWHRGYLIVGLPLLQALSEDEFKAVLAHELGHLSAQHGRFAGWVYRTRASWGRLMGELEDTGHWGAGLFTSFLEWYVPRFNACTFVLARQDEYVADAYAASVTSSAVAGQALVRLERCTRAHHLDFWPTIERLSARQEFPPRDLSQRTARYFAELREDDLGREYIADALAQPTGLEDTHPSLSDRLEALGVRPPGPAGLPPVGTRAVDLLGDALPALAAQIDEAWVVNAGPSWRDAHDRYRRLLKRRGALDQKCAAEPLSVEERTEHALIAVQVDGAVEARSELEAVAACEPVAGPFWFSLGAARLRAGESSAAVEAFERAMRADVEAIAPSCQLLTRHFRGRGDEAAARRWTERFEQELGRLQRMSEERDHLPPDAALEPPRLDDETRERLRDAFGMEDEIVEAFATTRVLEYSPEHPQQVFGLVLKHHLFASQVVAARNRVLEWVADAVALPPGSCVVVLREDYKPMRDVMSEVEGARLK